MTDLILKITQIISIVLALVAHGGFIAYRLGRVMEKMKTMDERAERLERIINIGELRDCRLHAQRIQQLEKRLDMVEEIERG